MRNGVWRGLCAVAGMVTGLGLPAMAPALAEQPVQLAQAAPCPANFTGHGADAVIECTCTGGVGEGGVWGTATYTNDSSICSAARHAGLIAENTDALLFAPGGSVRVAGTGGCAAYSGSTRNGVTSQSFGVWQASFYFPDASGPGCAQTFDPLRECPADFTGMAADTVLDCLCPANAGGNVWGTWTYTNDSSICAAARQAGAVGSSGGPVRVAGFGACDGYAGSTANGISSSDFGAWQASFYFPAVSGPGCVAPPPPEVRNYAIHFVGLQCIRRAQPFFLEGADAALAVAFVVEADGTIRESYTLPQANDYYEGLVAGQFRQANVVVWEGVTQDIDLHALLYKYDPVLPEILGGLIRVTSAIGGALVAVGTGGTGAVAGAGAAIAGEAAASEVERRMREVATPLGHSVIDVDLTHVGDPATQPLKQAGPIRYHFKTTHSERGAQYELYWVVR